MGAEEATESGNSCGPDSHTLLSSNEAGVPEGMAVVLENMDIQTIVTVLLQIKLSHNNLAPDLMVLRTMDSLLCVNQPFKLGYLRL